MLYIFFVDTGSMMTFDMNLALQTVSNLKKAIANQCQIPEEKQVLLISGGESLNITSRVCSYSSAGTDTSPIFLFSKNSIESLSPPTCVTDYGPDLDMSERVQSCIDMNPNYNTVVARAEMAQQLYEMAKQQLHNCERLVHDQHLQQQGWAAVVANLEDIVSSFSNSAIQLEEHFCHFIEDNQCYTDLLLNFGEDLKILALIPILTPLLSNNMNESESISLLEWISQKDDQNSLEQVAEHCSRGLEQFDLPLLSKVKEEVEEILDSCNNTSMKEVKGLEERLYGLEKLMCEAKKIVDEQRELAQAFYQNQTRASNLRDPSILPDLCASHQQQLQVMLKNHHKLRDYRKRCVRAKEELSGNLHARLRWIMFIEKKLSDIDAKILVYREKLRRLKKHLEVVHQIHLAPKIYLASVVEVVRRKSFSNAFIQWASSLAQQSSQLVDNEIALRQSFSSQLNSHFLQYLFPGTNDFPPHFANDTLIPFDLDLPQLSDSDVQKLRVKLPQLSDLLVVPSRVPMPKPSSNELSSNSNEDKDSVEKQTINSKRSESDTEEFEKVNDESHKCEDSVTKLSPMNQTDKELCLSETNDFLIEETNEEKLREIYTNTSFTALDIEELETKLEEFNKQLSDKSNELIATQENYVKSEDKLNLTNTLVHSLLEFSSKLISTLKDFKTSLRSQYSDISSEHLSSLSSLKEQLTDWLVLKEKSSIETQFEFNKTIDDYENRMNELNGTIDSMKSKLNSFEEIVKSDKNKIELLNKEINDKNSEINCMKEENIEAVKQMTLEHELEITALNEEFGKLVRIKDSMEGLMHEKDVQLDCLKRSHENLESNLLERFQEEKQSLIHAMDVKAKEMEQQIRYELEGKIKQMDRNRESTFNELRLRLDEEKAKSLVELKDQLGSVHKNELESLRHRYKLAISTTSMERTPSESSLEKVQLDIVDQLAQDREVNRLKQMVLDEKQRSDDLLIKLRKEKEDEIKTIRSSFQAERQVIFNEALNKLANERDILLQQLTKKEEAFQSSASIISNIISNTYSLDSHSSQQQIMDSFQQIKDEINSLTTNLREKPNESTRDIFLRRSSSKNLLTDKEEEILRLQKIISDFELNHSTSLGRIERVAVLGCEVGDLVLIYFEEKFQNFIVFLINTVTHFLHTDCWESLSLDLKSDTGEVRKRWTIAEVTDKEYCQAKRQPNRYNVPINTKFYRVKAKPWSKITSLINNRYSLENRTTFSASSTFSRNELINDTVVGNAMSSSSLPMNVSTSSAFQMSQSCFTTKSTDISKN